MTPAAPAARIAAAAFIAAALAAFGGCPSTTPAPTPSPDRPDAGAAPPALDDVARSTKNELLWKRQRALANGLATSLNIPVEDVCNELGRFSCVDVVHQVALGGNDPFGQALYEALETPGATTALAYERVVLAACSRAVELDAARAAPVVFRGLPLTADPLDATSPDTVDGARFLGTILVQRVHAREPLAAELDAIDDLIVDDDGHGISGRDFAKLACFAVASTTENLLQ